MEYIILFIISAVMLGASAAILTRAGERKGICKYSKDNEGGKK